MRPKGGTGLARLTDDQIDAALGGLEGWTRAGQMMQKVYAFPTFPEAIAFVVRLAFEAEAADHHPDLVVNYRKVTVSYTTHSEGGLTRKDVDGANTTERMYRHNRARTPN